MQEGTKGGDVDVTPDDETLDVKIVSLDHYRPRQERRERSYGQRQEPPTRPVIRVFGIVRRGERGGEKIAVHVHGVLPYFFVPVPDIGSVRDGLLRAVERREGEGAEVHFGRVFWRALDGALELHHAWYSEADEINDRKTPGVLHGQSGLPDLNREDGVGDFGSLLPDRLVRRRVADVQVVRATAFYGYHKHAMLWLKIYMYNPSDVKRASSLVGSGAVLGVRFQPHESHIPFLLQFKIDHNLYGMDWMRLKGGCWRGRGRVHSERVNERFTVAVAAERQTTCALELDVSCQDIVNTYEKKRVNITTAPMEEQIVDSLVPMWAEERGRQGRWDVGPTPIEVVRRVEQIDSVTVGYWRDKFREAEEKRRTAEGVAEGTMVANAAEASQPFSEPPASHPTTSQPESHVQGSDADLLESLIDADAVRATQWMGSGALTARSNRSNDADPIDSYTERQRELGYILRDDQDDILDEDDRLMELAGLVRGEEAATTQRATQLDRVTAPSRFFLEQRVQNALQEGALSARTECQDIMEASQLFDAEIKMIEAADPGFRGHKELPEETFPGPTAPIAPVAPIAPIPSVAAKREREQVLEAGRRLSEIRRLWRSSGDGSGWSEMPPPPPKNQEISSEGREMREESGDGGRVPGDRKPMTSQDRMDFWTEPASQVMLFEDTEHDDGIKNDDRNGIGTRTIVLEPMQRPPARLEVASLPVVHTAPHFSNVADVSKRTQVFGGKRHQLKTSSVLEMPRFGSSEDWLTAKLGEFQGVRLGVALASLMPAMSATSFNGTTWNPVDDAVLIELPRRPPTWDEVDRWAMRVRAAREKMRQATKSAVVVHGPSTHQALATRLDGNSGKFLPESSSATSQASLMGTPLLPSWLDGESLGIDEAFHCLSSLPSLHIMECADLSRNVRKSDLPVAPAPASSPPPPSPSPPATIRPASPKYDEIDALYRDVFVGADADADDKVIRRGSRMQPNVQTHRQSFSQISWGGSKATEVTPESQMGLNPFKKSPGKGEGLTVLCVEVHAESRQGLLPDPARDAVCAVVLTVYDDCETVVSGQYYTRIIMVKHRERVWPNFEGMQDVDFDFVASERDLFARFGESVLGLDPDMLMGFEIQNSSLGYLSDRARWAFENPSFLSDISRVPSERVEVTELGENDQYGWAHDSGLRVAGRIVLNMWRTIRAEVKLQSYTFENCVASILKIRVPHIKRSALHSLFKRHETRWRCLSHYVLCNRLCLRMIEQLDFIRRTSELARTFGIDFFSVISRGSQYRVESMMVRLAHSQNYIALSPNNEQVARQPAMEALPLVMEPESGMYEDPVCVLDFQSLYPSMIIAYNLCFSTCVGRPRHLYWRKEDNGEEGNGCGGEEPQSRPPRLGCWESFGLDASLAESDIDPTDPSSLIVTPNGIGFVSPSHRRGVLPRLLHEILQTRIMIKSAMRNAPADAKSLSRSLNAKQFALKLIANVTYGYTAAGFSGRMPMAELADAIVQSGRETLEDTIRFIKSHPDWRDFADIIYGDTDSIFVRLKGRTLEEAHRIGQEIAKAVTSRNPDPVLLKLEKVYHPCFLLSKKRYVGAMYERPDQSRYQFDAKGIETVRRDSCPAVSKIVEQSLRILFSSADISGVKAYVERQWKRIISGRVSVMDFIFAKEVRLGTYAGEANNSSTSIPPAALVATKAMAKDPRREPRFGERVRYVVVHGEPGARLIDMVVEPETLVESGGALRLHAAYYITKQIIPALERFMRLIGVDVQIWYSRIPKTTRLRPPAVTSFRSKSTIDQFYLSRHCVCCEGLTTVNQPLCDACQVDTQLAAFVLGGRRERIERRAVVLGRLCSACGGVGGRGKVVCESLDCPVYFERRKVSDERGTVEALWGVIV